MRDLKLAKNEGFKIGKTWEIWNWYKFWHLALVSPPACHWLEGGLSCRTCSLSTPPTLEDQTWGTWDNLCLVYCFCICTCICSCIYICIHICICNFQSLPPTLEDQTWGRWNNLRCLCSLLPLHVCLPSFEDKDKWKAFFGMINYKSRYDFVLVFWVLLLSLRFNQWSYNN